MFPGRPGPLRLELKRKVYQQYQRGESVEALAQRFCRTRASIYRIIAEVRAARIMELPLDFIPNDLFPKIRSRRREDCVIGPLPDTEPSPKKFRTPSDLPPYLASLYETPLLTRRQEAHLFRKMNYLKYKADRFRAKLDLNRPKRALMDRIERFYDEAVATRNQIIRANLRLVVSIAKRHVRATQNFFELVSDGNLSLMRAVDKFDYGRGNKFSTYASWAIMKNFARSIPDELRRRERFPLDESNLFNVAEQDRAEPAEQEAVQGRREAQVERMLKRLDDREQRIIIRRFGLRHGQEPLTLKEVGAELGVTKERIRQIEARALDKLRQAAAEDRVELPE